LRVLGLVCPKPSSPCFPFLQGSASEKGFAQSSL
jgi:hypothetical protein